MKTISLINLTQNKKLIALRFPRICLQKIRNVLVKLRKTFCVSIAKKVSVWRVLLEVYDVKKLNGKNLV